MKHFFLIYIIFVAYHQNLFSQHEFSIGLGGANYYGDLNKANSQTPVSLLTDFNANAIHGAASIGYRYNFPEFFSFGIDFSTMTVSGWDADNNTTGLDFFRHRRNLHFFSNVTDAGLTLNYEPLRNGQAKPEYFVSPYVGAGIGAFMFDPRANYLDNEIYLKDLGTEGQNTSNPERKY
ncbi:MAG: DUF6089 family protein, partial [Chitinophagales bacterium]|nr:DUF6089 family protein [Chitinophagales bacterium]